MFGSVRSLGVAALVGTCPFGAFRRFSPGWLPRWLPALPAVTMVALYCLALSIA